MPGAHKLIILPLEREAEPQLMEAKLEGNPMLDLTNLALLTYVLVLVGMVIVKLMPGVIPVL